MSDFVNLEEEIHFPDLPKSERLLLAQEYWFRNQPPSITIAQLARRYGVSRSTLDDRIKRGVLLRDEANQAMQRLSSGEEQALHLWIC
jgi:helix-turn-helix, Psq domain